MNKNKTALVLGASGLVGNSLLDILLESAYYSKVVIFVRKDIGKTDPKLVQHIVDFDKPESYEYLVKGNDLYCCLGTTIKQAGSQEAFRKVDYEYPIRFADIAKKNGVGHYLLVSSIGADSQSSVFYLRTKGECENALANAGLDCVSIFRPASLSGDRKEFRLGEKISLPILKAFSFLLVGRLKRYKPVEASQVAKAMYLVGQNPKKGFTIFESDVIRSF